jgi:hypothetical protein
MNDNKSTCTKHPNGAKYWCLNGQLHRKDGPAVEWPDGTKMWYLYDRYHREDGPAVEYHDCSKCSKYWYLDGINFTEEDFWKEIFKRGKITEKELFLKLL